MARDPIEPEIGERRFPMTYEEWLVWDGAHEGKSEWVDGEVIIFPPSTIRHAEIAGFVLILLSSYARFWHLGEVLPGSVEMRLSDRSSRLTDGLFVAREHLDRLTDERLLGPADLVVEVVSDDSVERDREEKFREYAAAGVPEYWLIDARPGEERADFYHLIDGAYQAVPPDADGRYYARALPGFWLRPEWLWQEPLPDTLSCLLAIAPEAIAAAQRRAATP
jgi:Uma2 family endonuclease